MKTHADKISDFLPDLKRFLDVARDGVVLISHVDADGLCAATMLKRFLNRRGIAPEHVYPDKGENAYSPGTIRRLRDRAPRALVVLDLGVMDRTLVPSAFTLFVDHHRQFGRPRDALVVSSYGVEPAEPTADLVYRLLAGLEPVADLAWLRAVGTAGDVGTGAAFAHGRIPGLTKRGVAEAEILINSAGRSSGYAVGTAVALLEEARGLDDLVDRAAPAVKMLIKCRHEVNREVRRCRHERPYFVWKVALIPFKSPCGIQGLIAETWRRQLGNYLVIAANFGYVEGKVAYAIRTDLETSVIDFLESLKPPGYDDPVAFGHDRAGGGVLDQRIWASIAERMGFRGAT